VRLILASSSPRRIELFSRISPDFIAIPSDVDESASGPPERRVATIARAKAEWVARRHHGLVIGADTIVVLDGEVLGKPTSRSAAREMLRRLSGRAHRVLTGLYVVFTFTGQWEEAFEETEVVFRELTSEEIEWYLKTGEYADKAGGYGIQEKGGLFVERISGDYFNVVGLPLCRLYLMLRSLGYRLPGGSAAG